MEKKAQILVKKMIKRGLFEAQSNKPCNELENILQILEASTGYLDRARR